MLPWQRQWLVPWHAPAFRRPMRPRSKPWPTASPQMAWPLRAIAIVGNRESAISPGNLDFDAMGLDPIRRTCSGAVMLVGSGRFRSRLLSCSFCSLFVDSPAPDVLDALAPVLKVFSTRLLVRGPNSSSLNRASICATSTVPNVRSSISTPRSTSRTSALTLRLSLTWSILAAVIRLFCRLISSACSQMPSREPNWLIHLAAKPSPTPAHREYCRRFRLGVPPDPDIVRE